MLPAGEAKEEPQRLLENYMPRHRVDLFDTRFYLTDTLKNPAVRFAVAYVVQRTRGRVHIHPRIFYKDVSLMWRVVSHMVAADDYFWIGKGLIKTSCIDGEEVEHSVESTTDLPLELQLAVEDINRRTKKVRENEDALFLVVRNAPMGRIAPYHDFRAPFERVPTRERVHRDRPIARFGRAHDPSSLRITRGYEPDFVDGVIEETRSRSATYGGQVRRFRVLSMNRRIQWLFFATKNHAWVAPPQALTTELSTYGVRTVHVYADDMLFVPGYEYHYVDESAPPEEHFSQIPPGYAGAAHPWDGDRADASAWTESLPIIAEFRRALL